jgi:riboflavin kinase/FMN adenylyltransferase
LKADAPRYGFEVEEIPRQDVDTISVSSTKIRKALEEGDVETASHLLGKPYSITGRVVLGDKLGRILGFPTANIEIDTKFKLIPEDGIYAVTVSYEHALSKGMMYIGNRPTVNGTRRNIEVNIFDFNKQIYGESITIHFQKLIRADIKFNDLEELKKQLFLDQEKALKYLEGV